MPLLTRLHPLQTRLWQISLAIYWPAFVLLLHWPLKLKPAHPWDFSDKIVHTALYAILAFLVAGTIDALAHRWPAIDRLSAIGRMALVFVAVCLHGLLDEVTQPLTSRTFDWWDLAADAVGAIVALVIYGLLFVRIAPNAVASRN
jgi:VanZ family protein